jgi:DUF1365 family protein
MRSHLPEGKVRHRRARPRVYELEHDVFYFALDLAELDDVFGRLRLVSRNRRNVVSFRDADYLVVPSRDIDADLRAHLRSGGVDPEGWRIMLISSLRVLGYVFNPASFYLCRDTNGILQVVVVEVHNTFGERHVYTLRPEAEGDRFVGSMDKAFFVSPFIGMEGRYTVRVRDDHEGVRLAINERHDEEQVLTASLVLRRRRLTDRVLARMLVRHPVLSHRTMGLILWHALRLWLRGTQFYRHGQVARPTGGGHATP